MTARLESIFRRCGIPSFRQTVEPGRDNLIARLDGTPTPAEGGQVVLLDAHQDTVPVDGMTIEPFAPVVRDQRLFGRGACDTKGGMAAMIGAMARLAADQSPTKPTVVMACTVNEEYGFSGARALPELWERGGGFVPRRPDAALVAEPTELHPVVAHKGVVRWRLHTLGKAAHGANPEDGENAIYKMGAVLARLEHYQKHVVGQLAAHPLCGPSTLNVGTIRGGMSVNTVPDRCTVELDRRLPPGESPEEAYRHLVAFLEGEAGVPFPVVHDPPFMDGLALSDERNADLARRVAEAVGTLGLRANARGVSYATDGAFFDAAGVPTVVVGPGSIAQAHTVDEWISVDQLEQAAEMYFQILRGFG
jgi:acetylornithine deacetylase